MIQTLKSLDKKHPNVIQEMHFLPEPSYASIQTPFMASIACRESVDPSRFDNGLVTDAAMSYFNTQAIHVIITSAFCEDLHRWAPAFITITDGQSAAHYEKHFTPLIISIYKRCKELGIDFVDYLIAMV